MSNIFFTSDTHFFHENVIKFCNRPFSSVEHMNESLVNNWNSVVEEKDIVYFLGDVSFGKPVETKEILQRLKGHKILITGNHDRKGTSSQFFKQHWQTVFDEKHDYLRLKANGYKFVLCHFPFASWERGYINLHGHWHTLSPETYSGKWMQWDVGVDANNYTPVSLEEAVKKALSDERKPV